MAQVTESAEPVPDSPSQSNRLDLNDTAFGSQRRAPIDQKGRSAAAVADCNILRRERPMTVQFDEEKVLPGQTANIDHPAGAGQNIALSCAG